MTSQKRDVGKDRPVRTVYSGESEEEMIKAYKNNGEIITISLYPNGKYYNNYGCCIAGGYDTLEEAESLLHKHRPQAVEVKEA